MTMTTVLDTGTTLHDERRPAGRRRRAAAALTALASLTATVAIGLTSPAGAASVAQYRVAGTGGYGVTARTTPTAAPGANYGAPEGSVFGVQCQTIGQPVGPRGNTLYLLSEYGGRVFYIPDFYTSSPHLAGQPPIAGIPMCGAAASQGSTGRAPAPPAATTAADRAVSWARSQVGHAYASPADAAAYSDWAPGPRGEWSGDCIKFVHRAYALAGISIPRGNASAVYNTYRGRGQISRTGTPPAGALVFWDVARPYGHVALSVGGGQVIGTRGMDFARLPVQQYAINAIPGYLGWVMPR